MNTPTIVITVFIFAICIFITIRGVINRKNGKGGCSCGCGGCAMSDICKGNNKNKE